MNKIVYILLVLSDFKHFFRLIKYLSSSNYLNLNFKEIIMTVNSLSLTSTNPQRQAGYTLIELSITLSIIAVLLVGTLTGVQR